MLVNLKTTQRATISSYFLENWVIESKISWKKSNLESNLFVIDLPKCIKMVMIVAKMHRKLCVKQKFALAGHIITMQLMKFLHCG